MAGESAGRRRGASPVCAGRAEPLKVLHEQLGIAAAGAPRVVWVEGEPGMGKTTLVRTFLADVPHRAVWASGDEAEMELPYGLLAPLHREIAATTDRVPSASTDPLTAGAELLVGFGASDDPLVVVIDDLQWADSPSASALRFALRRLVAERLLVVLITRPDPGGSLGEPWARMLSDGQLVTRVHLGGLTTDGVVELLAVTGHGQVGLPVAERLRMHTNGSPLHARALLDELGGAALRGTGVLPAPRSFAQLTVGRLAALADDARRLVTAGAVLGQTFPLGLAASVGDVTGPIEALDSAVAAGLLEQTPEGDIRFAHPLMRGAVYNDISPSQVRALHQAAAATMDGARSLEHRVSAAVGSDDVLAADLERLAVKELLTGRGSVAHDHFQAAARLTSDVAVRDRRVLVAVEALFSAGAFARVYGMRQTVMGCRESAHRSYVLGVIDTTSGAVAHFSAAAAGADDEADIPLLRLRAIGGRAIVLLRQGQFEAALSDANETTTPGVEGWASGLMRWVQVVSLANLGRTEEAWAVLERPRPRPSRTELDDLCARGLLEVVDDRLEAAVEDLSAVAHRARAGETCRLLEFALSLLATAQYRLGRWDESAMNSDLAVALYGEAGRPLITVAHSVAAFVHAGRGLFDLAEADVAAAEEANRAIVTAGGACSLAVARAVLAQARGDMEGLVAATAPLLDGRVVPTVEGLDRWGWHVLAIEGLLGTGDFEQASRRLGDLIDLVEAHRLRSPRWDIARLRGQLAEASNDSDAALAAYATGTQAQAGGPTLPLPAARLALAYGSLLRRTGERRAAFDQLRSAHAGFAALGATPFLEVCVAELSAGGLVAPAADPSRPLQLTPTEQTVAHLIAGGMTNREAAAQLYVSPKTIEYHLGNIFGKLGISSRRDLARWIRPLDRDVVD